MPLVNEVVIGLDDKDRFNASRPKDDAAKFADYVTNPVLPALIETLFPERQGADQLSAHRSADGLPEGYRRRQSSRPTSCPAEMLRLNTSVPAAAAAAQNPLGVAAGDKAGFPNGRRPGDDVVDLSLRVAMGALCVLTGANDALQVGCKPSDAPAGGLALTDGVRKSRCELRRGVSLSHDAAAGQLQSAGCCRRHVPLRRFS